jgi:hypothetical protein
MDSSSSSHVTQVEPVTVVRTGRPGRPRKLINKDWLAEGTRAAHGISQRQLAHALGLHHNTVNNYKKLHNINTEFSEITDAELDGIVRQYKAEKPSAGYRYVIGFLRSQGLHVQRDRITRSIHRVDRLG